MKKNILGLLILSSLPLFSTISNFNATKNIEAVIKQPIKKKQQKFKNNIIFHKILMIQIDLMNLKKL